jgi:hypothetical protein
MASAKGHASRHATFLKLDVEKNGIVPTIERVNGKDMVVKVGLFEMTYKLAYSVK